MNTQLPDSTSGERRSGRTTRMLVQALMHMLRGGRGVVVGHSHIHAVRLYRQAVDWLSEYGWMDQQIAPIQGTGESIRFGSGHLRFVSYKSTALRDINLGLSGKEQYKQYWDHHAEACRAEDLARKARQDALVQIEILMKAYGWGRIELRMSAFGEHALPIQPDGRPYVRT